MPRTHRPASLPRARRVGPLCHRCHLRRRSRLPLHSPMRRRWTRLAAAAAAAEPHGWRPVHRLESERRLHRRAPPLQRGNWQRGRFQAGCVLPCTIRKGEEGERGGDDGDETLCARRTVRSDPAGGHLAKLLIDADLRLNTGMAAALAAPVIQVPAEAGQARQPMWAHEYRRQRAGAGHRHMAHLDDG